MTKSIQIYAAMGALALITATPANADYTILEDSSLPSVLFVEFSGVEEPLVIIAPGESASLGDPALAPIDGDSNGSQLDGDAISVTRGNTISDSNDPISAPQKSVEDRINERVVELEKGAPQSLEDIAIDDAINQEVLKDTPLR